MTSEAQLILRRLDVMEMNLARMVGSRLTRAQVCERLGIHRNTLANYIKERDFPTPGRDGKWLLSEVLDWESRK